MCCGKRLRCLIPFFVLALDAVQAARPGLQPSALTPTQTGRRRKCGDMRGTISEWQLRKRGVKKWYDMEWFRQQRCYCWPRHYSHPSNGCGEVEEVEVNGDTYRSFRLSSADSSCECLLGREKAEERSRVVEAAAVRFCAAVMEKTIEAGVYRHHNFTAKTFVQEDLALSPELCQEVLTGTLDDFNASQKSKDVFDEANRFSQHKDTKGFGRLDPLVTGGLPAPKEYQKLLHHVCKDECEEIVNETVENIVEMDDDVHHAIPSEESCADRVVRRVEAEMLGCCGRSCGWNNRSCASWPFFTKEEKVEWLQECCSEFNVLQNSSREEMCDSVLSRKQVRLISHFDTKAKKGDVAGAYMGQDPPLLWAKPGLDQFEEKLKTLKQKPKENEPVTSDFFEKNPDVRKKGLQNGWFTEEKDPQEKSSSLVEIGGACQSHDLEKMKHCPPQTQRDVLNDCFQAEKWQISKKPDPDDLDLECQLKMINPDVNRPQPVATPSECLKVDFGQVVKRRFFTYDKSDPPAGKVVLDNPILCFFYEKEPCPKDDFVRKKLNDVDRHHFSGFADYIYWFEES